MLGNSSNTGGGNRTFLKIFDGHIVTEWKEKPQNMTDVHERLNKNDVKVYYKQYDFVEGHLVSADLEDSPFGQIIKVTLADGAETYTLDIHADSRYGFSFFYKMLGINTAMPVRIKPYSFTGDDGKSLIGISITQGGDKVTYDFGKDVVPELAVKSKGGKTTYDNTDRYNFFLEKFGEFKARVSAASPSVPKPMAMYEGPPDEEMDSDLPF